MIKTLRKLSYEIWVEVTKLYVRDPVTHAYLLYDLLYELSDTDAYFQIEEGRLTGYLLVWRGGPRVAVHLWTTSPRSEELVGLIPTDSEAVVQLYDSRLLDPVLRFLEARGCALVRRYHNMVVEEEEFRPYASSDAVRLSSAHLQEFLELTSEWERPPSPKEIEKVLARWRWYGVFAEGKLVSVASAYLRLPEVWYIGGVYTRREFRGRGYAKAVTSAVTRDALSSGAVAALHVAVDNEPAKRVYEHLGYRYIGTRPWVFYSPK